MATPFGAAATTWVLSVLADGGQWAFWHNLDPVKEMAGLGTIAYGALAVLVEGGIKMVFWALDERRRKFTMREIEAMTEVRNRLRREQDATGVAIVEEMIEDRRRDPLRNWSKERRG